ncbi:MAG: FecR domain-containing protein [Planctomycetota bacterium]
MSKHPTHDRDEAILDLLDGNLPDEEQAGLRAWLDASPEHWQRLVELSFIHSQIADQLHNERSSAGVRLGAVQSVPELDLLPPLPPPTRPESPDALTRQHYVSALTYVLKHTFTPKRVAMLATAAALLLGAVLAIVLLSGPETPEQVANQNDQPNVSGDTNTTPDGPITPPVVATLTAEHDAVWGRRPGEDLFAGQRLELIKGSAEITTLRGSIAIIQSPAKIEMTYSKNAVSLHQGKLVGICETAESKGFLVRTPQMDVSDLGTRFGVMVGLDGNVFAEVFEGSVEIAVPSRIGTQPRVLERGDSIAVSSAGEQTLQPVTDEGVFNDLVARNAGIEEWSEQLSIVTSRPKLLGSTDYMSDTHAFVITEFDRLVLSSDIEVSFKEPGRYDKFRTRDLPGGVLPAGMVVRSYVIRASAISEEVSVQGRLRFDGPILGVMTEPADWNAFASKLPDQTIKIADMPSALLEGTNKAADGVGDWLLLHPDRKTIEFNLNAKNPGDDHIRVFIAAPQQPVELPTR